MGRMVILLSRGAVHLIEFILIGSFGHFEDPFKAHEPYSRH